MITAIDNYGEIYFSLLQNNSNNQIIELFLTYMVSLLDEQRKRWRNDTVFQLDGASWHTSRETIEVIERLKIPIIISAPYSYDAAPIERFFAYLKRGNLNPDGLSLTKSKYFDLFLILVEYLENVVRIIYERIAVLKKSHIVMYFYHATFEAWKYLDNRKLWAMLIESWSFSCMPWCDTDSSLWYSMQLWRSNFDLIAVRWICWCVKDA